MLPKADMQLKEIENKSKSIDLIEKCIPADKKVWKSEGWSKICTQLYLLWKFQQKGDKERQ